MPTSNLITQDELAERLAASDSNLSVLDASWYLSAQERDGKAEFSEQRIPSAQYFDIDAISDLDDPLPHMMPSPERFADKVGKLGVAETDTIVVYDGLGIFSCARAWWMLKTMGARDVRVLEGGFDRWKANEHPIETGQHVPAGPVQFKPRFDDGRVRDLDDLMRNIHSADSVVLDARSAARFEGNAPEPRAGLRSGHIPGSKSLPFTQLTSDGTLKSEAELETAFKALGVEKDTPVITTCGSGVTAAVLCLALDSIGNANHSLYDGSWSQWGQGENTPVETG